MSIAQKPAYVALLTLPKEQRSVALSFELDFEAGEKTCGWLELEGPTKEVYVRLISRAPNNLDPIRETDTHKVASHLLGERVDSEFAPYPPTQSAHTLIVSWGLFPKQMVMQAAARWAANVWEQNNKKKRKRGKDPQTELKELVAFKLKRDNWSNDDICEIVNRATRAKHDDAWVRASVISAKSRIAEARKFWSEHAAGDNKK